MLLETSRKISGWGLLFLVSHDNFAYHWCIYRGLCKYIWVGSAEIEVEIRLSAERGTLSCPQSWLLGDWCSALGESVDQTAEIRYSMSICTTILLWLKTLWNTRGLVRHLLCLRSRPLLDVFDKCYYITIPYEECKRRRRWECTKHLFCHVCFIELIILDMFFPHDPASFL